MAKEQKRGNKEARKPKDDKKNKKSKKDEPAANASSLMAANAPLGRQSKSKV